MSYKNLDKALLLLRKQVFFLKIWKLWRASTILQFNIFFWNFAYVFYLPLSKKAFVGVFLLYLDLELLAKIKKELFSTLSFFTLLLITQDLNKIKNPTDPFVDITKQKMCAKFQEKILKYVVVRARQSFRFLR